jgi:hypothetical protein
MLQVCKAQATISNTSALELLDCVCSYTYQWHIVRSQTAKQLRRHVCNSGQTMLHGGVNLTHLPSLPPHLSVEGRSGISACHSWPVHKHQVLQGTIFYLIIIHYTCSKQDITSVNMSRPGKLGAQRCTPANKSCYSNMPTVGCLQHNPASCPSAERLAGRPRNYGLHVWPMPAFSKLVDIVAKDSRDS